MMEEDPSKDKLRREAVDVIVENVDLTVGLRESTAGSMMFWPRVQARVAVDALSVCVDLTTLPAEDARRMLAERLAPVHRYVGAIKALASERKALTRRQAYRRLEWIRDLAQELPSPPQVVPSKHMLTRFAAWVPEIDDHAYVRTLVIMLANVGGRLEDMRIGSGREYVFRYHGYREDHVEN